MTYEQNTQWLEASKHDVTQWAAVMERDADERIIDWDWVCSLDFVAGVGAGARLDLVHDEYDAHALLMQDYAVSRVGSERRLPSRTVTSSVQWATSTAISMSIPARPPAAH